MTRPLLVTTALEQTWGSDEPILYAGEWCRLYDRKHAWSRRRHEVLPYHWGDRAKLLRDYQYLDDLQESLLVHIAESLNRYHNLDRPVRYWRIVLGPWLPTYAPVLFDRWECLRVAFEHGRELETIALPSCEHTEPPLDGDTFINSAAYSAEWNHGMFLRIIRRAYQAQCDIRGVEAATAEQPGSAAGSTGGRSALAARVAKAMLRMAARELDAAAGALFRRSKVTFVVSYFPLSALVRLNLALGQVPRLHMKEFEYPMEFSRLASAREVSSLRIARAPTSQFEEFLTDELARNIPRAYVEGFPELMERVRQIRISTRAICSANAHWSNELFKLWCAEQVLKGTKLVALTHGGAIPVLIDQTMYFEEKISDKKVTWTIPYQPNHVRLPPNKLVSWRVKSSKRLCSVITQETPLHPFRASGGPIGVDVLESITLVCKLFTGLRPEIQQLFRVKPYRNLGWNTRQRFSDAIGADKIFAGASYKSCLARSRVVICTYPETTFAEAMASGLPTLLVYAAHLWETIPQMEGLLDTLRAASIVFDDPQLAADHVNRIWSDPDTWWSSPSVMQARNQFFSHCLELDGQWLAQWTAFMRGIAA